MAGEIIRLNERPIDPNKDYYALPLEERFAAYLTRDVDRAYDHKHKVLKPVYDNDYRDGRDITPKGLTEELRRLVPSFHGTVLRRDYAGWPSYVLPEADMGLLFPDTAFGTVTGRVITADDNLLAPEHADLAGYLILIAEQQTEEMEAWIARHESYHQDHSRYPNAMRRDQYNARLRDTHSMTLAEIVRTMIALDQAAQIDEAGAVLESYSWAHTRTWKPWKPGRNGEQYDVNLVTRMWEGFDSGFIEEFRNSARNRLGFQLSKARRSGNIDDLTLEAINQHEKNTILFPGRLKRAIENIAERLQNPDGTDPLMYAITYVTEALQILDYKELFDGTLEKFCVKILEPHRLKFVSGVAAAFAQALRRDSN